MKTETLMRQLLILKILPVEPIKMDSRSLQRRLEGHSVYCTLRTVQRDLEFIESCGLFGILADRRSKPVGWSWMRHAHTSSFAFWDINTAVSLTLLQQAAASVLSPTLQQGLQPLLARANSLLADRKHWLQSIDFPAHKHCPNDDLDILYQALQQRCCVSLEAARYIYDITPHWVAHASIEPLGLQLQNGRLRLLANISRGKVLQWFSVENIRHLRLLQQPITSDLDFALYCKEMNPPGLFKAHIELSLKLNMAAAKSLQRQPLSCNQVIDEQPNGSYRLKATVDDTAKLRQYLLSLAASVQVLAPDHLRGFMCDQIKKMSELYA